MSRSPHPRSTSTRASSSHPNGSASRSRYHPSHGVAGPYDQGPARHRNDAPYHHEPAPANRYAQLDPDDVRPYNPGELGRRAYSGHRQAHENPGNPSPGRQMQPPNVMYPGQGHTPHGGVEYYDDDYDAATRRRGRQPTSEKHVMRLIDQSRFGRDVYADNYENVPLNRDIRYAPLSCNRSFVYTSSNPGAEIVTNDPRAIYGWKPIQNLEKFFDAFMKVEHVSKRQARNYLGAQGRQLLLDGHFMFGCLADDCRGLFKTSSQYLSGVEVAFKNILAEELPPATMDLRPQLTNFLVMLCDFASEKGTADHTRMLVLFLSETILRLNKTQRAYQDLLEIMHAQGIISGSYPMLSEGFGRHNSTPADAQEDAKFNGKAIRFLLEHLFQYSSPDAKVALVAAERIETRFCDDDKFQADTATSRWWKGVYCYERPSINIDPRINFLDDVIVLASAYKEKIRSGEGVSRDHCQCLGIWVQNEAAKLASPPQHIPAMLEALGYAVDDWQPHPAFGEVSEAGLTITEHGILCGFAEAWPPEHKQLTETVGVGRLRKPKNNAEAALSGTKHSMSDFEVLGYLGGGSFGKVLRVRLKKDHSVQFALKLIAMDLKNAENGMEDMKSICREVSLASQVKSKHVARTYGFFPIKGLVLDDTDKYTVALISELCGPTLRDFLKARTLREASPLERARRTLGIAKQLFEGISAMQSKNLIHRDLKPANICMGAEGVVKIVDMGLLRNRNTKYEELTKGVGTPDYCPPSGGDEAHDEYSMGVIIHELMSGKRPCQVPNFKRSFKAEEREMMKDLIRENFDFNGPEFAEGTPLFAFAERFLDLVMGLLEPLPQTRTNYVGAVQHLKDLTAMLKQEKQW